MNILRGKCHGPDAGERKADLRFDIEEGAFADLGGHHAIVRGNPAESELVRRITTADADEAMPPRKSNLTLTESQKEILGKWTSAARGLSSCSIAAGICTAVCRRS